MARPLELVTFVTRAESRVDALLALAAAPATRHDLQEATGIPRATLSRIIADFRERGLAERDGHEYGLTPLGALLAEEVGTLLDSIEAMQRLADVRRWLALDEFDFPVERLADADVVVPSSQDPTAPIRRAEELLYAGSRVRVAANSMIPGCLEAVWRAVTEGRQTFEMVTTPGALEVVAADPELTRWIRELLASDAASGHVHEEGFPQGLFVVDGTVFTAVSDGSGTIQGHVETDDDVVLEWAEGTLDAYVREAEPLSADALAA